MSSKYTYSTVEASQVDSRVNVTRDEAVAPVIALWSQVRKARRRSARCGHVGNPAGVVQALCEQCVMSITPGDEPMDSRRCHYVRFEQIAEQNHGVAVRTTSSQP